MTHYTRNTTVVIAAARSCRIRVSPAMLIARSNTVQSQSNARSDESQRAAAASLEGIERDHWPTTKAYADANTKLDIVATPIQRGLAKLRPLVSQSVIGRSRSLAGGQPGTNGLMAGSLAHGPMRTMHMAGTFRSHTGSQCPPHPHVSSRTSELLLTRGCRSWYPPGHVAW